jgi:hypothetical protein
MADVFVIRRTRCIRCGEVLPPHAAGDADSAWCPSCEVWSPPIGEIRMVPVTRPPSAADDLPGGAAASLLG